MSGTDTKVLVRVIARDGKFLGDDIGGALVTIRDAHFGELLASGRTTGGSGNTKGIMQTPRTRNQSIPTEDPPNNDACFFEATLSLEAPRLVEISALGPLAAQQSSNRVSATTWVYPGIGIAPVNAPGGPIRPDGISAGNSRPVGADRLPAAALSSLPPRSEDTIPISANVTMMCGCPIHIDPWPADDFQVGASIVHKGTTSTIPLTFDTKAAAASQFTANWTPGDYGVFEITVWAFQISTGNTGVDHTTVNLQAPASSSS